MRNYADVMCFGELWAEHGALLHECRYEGSLYPSTPTGNLRGSLVTWMSKTGVHHPVVRMKPMVEIPEALGH